MAPIAVCTLALFAQAAPTPPTCAQDDAAPSGLVVHEVQANTFTYNRQMDPALAVDADGHVLAAWGSRRQEQGSFGVFAQLLDPLGRPLGTEIHVNDFVIGEQARPAVAFDDGGTAWVVWHSTMLDGSGVELRARRFGWTESAEDVGAGGARRFAALGDEFPVCQRSAGDQLGAVVAADPDGGVLVAWTGHEGLRRVAYGRWFAADGSPRGDEFRLSDDPHLNERAPVVARAGDAVVAAWTALDGAGQPAALRGALLHPGEGVRARFTVADARDGWHVEPSVDGAADGSFVVAWMSSQDGGDYAVRARRFGADGDARGEVLDADAGGSGYRSGVQVAVHPDGRFVVAHNVNEPKRGTRPGHRPDRISDVRARLYAADGAALGAPFRLNRFAEGEQTLQVAHTPRHLAWSAHGQIVAGWHGNTEQGDHRGYGITILAPESLNPPAPPPVEPRFAAMDVEVEDVYGTQAKPIYDPTFTGDPYVPPPPRAGGTGGFQAITNTGWNPPDPDLGVSATHLVCVANGEIAFFDKAGNNSFRQPIAGSGGFWGSVGAGGFVFDPVALYDPDTDRFIVAAADGAGSNDAICLAVSDDADPNGTWHKWRFPVSGTCAFLDFPNLGVSEDAIFLAGDCFSGGGNRVFFWDKSVALTGGSLTLQQLQTEGFPISLGATKSYDAGGTGYFATTYSSSSSRILIKAVTDPTGSPQLHEVEVTVPGFSQPNDAQQLGTSNRADTIDWRIKNGVVRNGHMWVCHNNGVGGRSAVRWYEFDLRGWPGSGSTPTLLQSGDLDLGSGEWTWFGDLNVRADGSAAIAFNRSSASQYISIEYVTRADGDPAGTMSLPKQLQISSSPENGSRWGDYSGVEQDPIDPNTFWSHHEYRTSGWRTWVGEFTVQDQLNLAVAPIVAGQNSTWTATGGLLGEQVHFLVSLNPGTTCPPQLGGLCLDMGAPLTLVGSSTVNAALIASLTVQVPANAPVGGTAHVQAAVQRGPGNADSIKSNLVTEVIQ